MRVGIYEVERELGRGGMGAVFLARDPRSGARVVVKRCQWLDADTFARFERETRIGKTLHHEGVVKTLDSGRDEQGPFLVMEWIEGETLAALLARGPLGAHRAATLVRDAARAVHHAHAQGVLHRDLKPQNILVDARGRPRVADFGLGRAATDATLSATGELLGTPSYVPPEQVADGARAHGVAGDVWALGAILHEALAGSPPFQAASTLALLRKIAQEAPAALPPDVPRALAAVVARSLEKDPRARFPTAATLANALDAALAAKPSRAKPAAAALVAGPVVVALAATAHALWPREPVVAPPPARPAPPPPRPAPPPPPLSAKDLLERAERAHHENRLLETLAILGSAVALDSASTRARETRALVLFELDRNDEAETEMRALSGRTLDRRGELLASGLLRGGADVDALTPPDDDEDAWVAHAMRAMRYGRTGRYDLAVAESAKACELAPWSAPVHRLEASMLECANDHAAAIERFDSVIASCPDLARKARQQRALTRMRAGDYAGALSELDALVAEADDPTCRFERAQIYQAQGGYGAALAEFAAAIRGGLQREDGYLCSAHWSSAKCELELGHFDAAVADCKVAFAVKPGDDNAYRVVVDAFQRALAARADHAFAGIEEAVADAPTDPGAWMLAAAAHQARGDNGGALGRLRKARALLGADPGGARTCEALIAALGGR